MREDTAQKRKLVRKQEIRKLTAKWSLRLQQALLTVENQRREEIDVEPFPSDTPVWIPAGHRSSLQLLNLRVWCIRYRVTPEFIIERLTYLYRRSRRCAANEARLGLSANTITSANARKFIEEEVSKNYPQDENIKMLRQPPQRQPLVMNEVDSPRRFVKEYARRIKKRATQTEKLRRTKFDRNFRREELRPDL